MEQTLEEKLEEIVIQLKKKDAHQTIKSLTTVCLNLMQHPKDEKVRTLRITNSTVSRTIYTIPEAMQFLSLIGFVEVDGFLSLVGYDVSLYELGVVILSRHQTKRKITETKSGDAQTPDRKQVVDMPIEKCSETLQRPPSKMQRVISPSKTWQDVLELKMVKNQLQCDAPFGECILLYGKSGSGKTLVAHAAAEAWGLKIFTIYGSELHTPFSKSRNSILKHFLKHAYEIGPCVILLKGMDKILSEVTEEIKAEFLTSSLSLSSQIVIMATCTSTNKLIPSSRCNLPRRFLSENKQQKPINATSSLSSCQPPIRHDYRPSSAEDQLSCFDILVHIPLLQDSKSMALLLQMIIENQNGILPTSVSKFVCTILRSYGDLSGHALCQIAEGAIKIAIEREKSISKLSATKTRISISSDVLRTAFEQYNSKNSG
mmetsp:Transcript_32040/g.41189  ORF Transcript_32040/g.41189 Transcript_32040/m.41189 type:complete len:430 (+) Transcript_32040:84-1373(+)